MTRVSTRVVRKKRMLDKYEKGALNGIRRAVALGAVNVQREAVKSIQEGGKSGVVYQKYNPRRVHQASAAGEPPASDTSLLASNISLDIDPDGLGASVDSRADYSSFLEFGTSKMAARPFMQPALEVNRKKIKANMAEELKKIQV